jgi:2-methylcitrate dehydratase PrpD
VRTKEQADHSLPFLIAMALLDDRTSQGLRSDRLVSLPSRSITTISRPIASTAEGAFESFPVEAEIFGVTTRVDWKLECTSLVDQIDGRRLATSSEEGRVGRNRWRTLCVEPGNDSIVFWY